MKNIRFHLLGFVIYLVVMKKAEEAENQRRTVAIGQVIQDRQQAFDVILRLLASSRNETRYIQ